MQGFAVLDRQADTATAAVWLTSRTASGVDHTNAVVIDLESDPDALRKVHALTRDRVLLLTDGSSTDGLPVSTEPLSLTTLQELADAATALHEQIVAAIREYGRTTGNKNLVTPQLDPTPTAADFAPTEDTPAHRALATANYVARLWRYWLSVDEQRRRRTVRPQSGESPWIMPEELGSPTLADFPADFRACLHPEPLEPFNA